MSLLANYKRKAFIIQYFEEERLWIPYDKGFLLTVDEAKELIDGLTEYIKHEDMIKEHNEEHLKEIEEHNNHYLQSTKTVSCKKPQGGYVYIVKFGTYFKIGRTKNMESRLGEYTKLPEQPEVLLCIEVSDYISAEENLHTVFDSKRVRGEWFDLSEKDLKKARKILTNFYKSTLNNPTSFP